MKSRTRNAALTEVEAAHELGVSAAVLRSWRAHGHGPRFCKFGRSVRYLRRDVDAFIEASAVSPDEPAKFPDVVPTQTVRPTR
jgi:predicted DNA-binding transcriptional regulator AlpA